MLVVHGQQPIACKVDDDKCAGARKLIKGVVCSRNFNERRVRQFFVDKSGNRNEVECECVSVFVSIKSISKALTLTPREAQECPCRHGPRGTECAVLTLRDARAKPARSRRGRLGI